MSVGEEAFNIAIGGALKDTFPEISSLTEHQYKALFNYINRRDVFCVLPTGYGKSLIFQMAPIVAKKLGTAHNFPVNPILLIICPLNSLIDSHVRELKKRGLRATSLSDEDDEQEILNGKFTFVFCNPESIIRSEKWRAMVTSDIYQTNLLGFVTDEAHVVPKW